MRMAGSICSLPGQNEHEGSRSGTGNVDADGSRTAWGRMPRPGAYITHSPLTLLSRISCLLMFLFSIR
jgi:hypothetical protein